MFMSLERFLYAHELGEISLCSWAWRGFSTFMSLERFPYVHELGKVSLCS